MRDAMTRWPWYAPVFAAYPLLYIAASNPGQVEGLMVVAVAAVAVIMAVVLVAILRPILGSWATAGLGAAWVVLLFYLYGPVNQWWVDFASASLEQPVRGMRWLFGKPQLVHTFLWATLVFYGLMKLRRVAAPAAARLAGGLNIAAGLLAAFALIQTLSSHADGGEEAEPLAMARNSTAVGKHAAAPDIYFIVLDAYARADVLAKYYDFDNKPFLDELRQLGFQVSDGSRANFYWTFLSIASALNFDYVQPLLRGRIDPQSRDRQEIYQRLRDNRAANFLKEHGYRTVHLQSTWSGTGRNPYADEFVSCDSGFFASDYPRAIAEMSWLRALAAQASLEIASCHLKNFESLAKQAKQPGPKFVLAHFVPPHHPYIFNREGQILRRATISDQFQFQLRLWEDRDAYVSQLVYMNQRIGEIIRRLIADSPRPPIILLLSDHGPRIKSRMLAREEWHVGFSTLTAMHMPGAPADLFPLDATPVNHFRRVFNFYFDAKLPLLPDRYFVSPYDRPYAFREVSSDDQLLPERKADF